MTPPIERTEILRRLRAQIDAGYPILCATAGNGLIARSLEAAHVDLLLTSVTGVSRQMGLPSIGWRMDDNNTVVLDIVEQIRAVTERTPLIASLGAGEPSIEADLGALIDAAVTAGYSGILNYPTVAALEAPRIEGYSETYHERAQRADATDYAKRVAAAVDFTRRDGEEKVRTGRGFARELEMISLAHERDVFTMAYAWSPEQAVQMVQAGADVIVGHCGGTGGGAAGEAVLDFEQAAEWLRSILEPAAQTRPDVILMGHGGPFSDPDATRRLYDLTDAMGFLSGSAVERIPVERVVAETVEAFRGTPLAVRQEAKA